MTYTVDTNRVDALFAQWDKITSPGCMLAVIRDGKFIFNAGRVHQIRFKKVK